MNLRRTPRAPENPRKISNKDAVMMAPCRPNMRSCQWREEEEEEKEEEKEVALSPTMSVTSLLSQRHLGERRMATVGTKYAKEPP